MIIPEAKKDLLSSLFDLVVQQVPEGCMRSPTALTWTVHDSGVEVQTEVGAHFQKRSWRIWVSMKVVFHLKGPKEQTEVHLRTYMHRLAPEVCPEKHLLAHQHEIEGVASSLLHCLKVSQDMQASLTDPRCVLDQLLKEGEPSSDSRVFVSSSLRQPYLWSFALCVLLPTDEGVQMQASIKKLFLNRVGDDPDAVAWWESTTKSWNLVRDQGGSEENL